MLKNPGHGPRKLVRHICHVLSPRRPDCNQAVAQKPSFRDLVRKPQWRPGALPKSPWPRLQQLLALSGVRHRHGIIAVDAEGAQVVDVQVAPMLKVNLAMHAHVTS